MWFPIRALLFALALGELSNVLAHPLEPTPTAKERTVGHKHHKQCGCFKDPPNCFPALGFAMPNNTPSSLNDWWCDPSTEYAFVGFSYEITSCPSSKKLLKQFLDIRQRFNGSDKIVDAAWQAGIGVQALIWFGFDGTDEWMGRRDTLFAALHSNPRAKFVTRLLQFGSEPLFDQVLTPTALIEQVQGAQANLSSLGIPVTVSDMAYSFRDVSVLERCLGRVKSNSVYKLHANDGGPAVIQAIDMIDAHMLPFFSQNASIANDSWPIILPDLNWFISQGGGKKIWFSENGWPSVTSAGVQPNSPSAVANVQNEKDYFNLLDNHCEDLKAVPGGGVGWFAHIYSDFQEPGYGIYDSSETKLKFPFAPRTSC
ncbi:hypothetical protein H0H92_009776 [Tricholoma furcatifolium]|nr:hypothetical protein H0H92_009776 [Tricholoma furcatifolium]